jgi:uncharacterized delta-60 repeat protein
MLSFQHKRKSDPRSCPRSARALLLCFSLILIAPLSLTFVRTSRGQAAAGDLDPTFGSGGVVTTDFDSAAMTIQPDGKIVTVDYDFALTRYNSDGTLDPTFGAGGHAFPQFAGNTTSVAVAIQADGKIVVAGTIHRASSPSGSAQLDPDGPTIEIEVSCSDDFAVARFNAEGSPDQTFGAQVLDSAPVAKNHPGLQIIDIGGRCVQDDYASDLAIQSDGKIVLVGATVPTFAGAESSPDLKSANFALARLNTDGSLDLTFGEGGTQITDLYPGLNDYAVGVAMQTVEVAGQPIERIVVAGDTGYLQHQSFININPPPPSPVESDVVNHFTLARYDLTGQLDATFGPGGRAVFDFSGQNGYVKDIAIQPDDKIVAVGGSVNQFVVVRCNPDGQLDQGFGDGWFGERGKATTAIGPLSGATSVGLQSDGKIVAAGFTQTDPSEEGIRNFALARYTRTGQLDTTFGAGGKIISDLNGQGTNPSAIAIQSNDKILVAGDYRVLARFLSKPQLSDLQVSNIAASDSGGSQGEKVTITATIANTGEGPATISATEFVLDGLTVLANVETPAIPVGGSATVSFNWDTRAVKGNHTIRVTADRTAIVKESEETNNTATLAVSIKGNKLAGGL